MHFLSLTHTHTRVYTRANASGKVWIMVDFMVLDVTRWLPEHPGGKTIIPGQALNVDATCFFEVRQLPAAPQLLSSQPCAARL